MQKAYKGCRYVMGKRHVSTRIESTSKVRPVGIVKERIAELPVIKIALHGVDEGRGDTARIQDMLMEFTEVMPGLT